jgi:hypothetical protein
MTTIGTKENEKKLHFVTLKLFQGLPEICSGLKQACPEEILTRPPKADQDNTFRVQHDRCKQYFQVK